MPVIISVTFFIVFQLLPFVCSRIFSYGGQPQVSSLIRNSNLQDYGVTNKFNWHEPQTHLKVGPVSLPFSGLRVLPYHCRVHGSTFSYSSIHVLSTLRLPFQFLGELYINPKGANNFADGGKTAMVKIREKINIVALLLFDHLSFLSARKLFRQAREVHRIVLHM